MCNLSNGAPIMPTVSQVVVEKLLGVYLRHDLNFLQQVESVVSTVIKVYIC